MLVTHAQASELLVAPGDAGHATSKRQARYAYCSAREIVGAKHKGTEGLLLLLQVYYGRQRGGTRAVLCPGGGGRRRGRQAAHPVGPTAARGARRPAAASSPSTAPGTQTRMWSATACGATTTPGNRAASVLYLDQPAFTGFSYSKPLVRPLCWCGRLSAGALWLWRCLVQCIIPAP